MRHVTSSSLAGELVARALCATAACAAGAACDVPSPAWSGLRDALTSGRDDALALARAADRVRFDELRAWVGSAADGERDVAAIDRARALAGDDALVAARYDRAGDSVVARDCGPLFADGAPDVGAWLARCRALDVETAAAVDARRPPQIVVASGEPALAAWLPDRSELRLHPALAARTGDDAAALGLLAAPLIPASPTCEADLDAWCEACPTGAEPGCAPLFPGQVGVTGCAELDAEAAALPSAAAFDWRARYCDWRYLATDPRARFWVIDLDVGRTGYPPCWDRSVRVRDLASLAAAFASYSADCDGAMAQGRSMVDADVAFPRALTPGLHETVAACSGFQRDVLCAACTPDPEGLCGSYFERSNMAEDCYDLGRAEAHGGGFGALCLYGAAKAFVDRGCFNLYDPCWQGFAGGTEALTTFEQLVVSAPGFFGAATAERCLAQADRCLAGNPLPDFDPEARIPTPPPATPTSSEEDGKCPL